MTHISQLTPTKLRLLLPPVLSPSNITLNHILMITMSYMTL